MIIRQYNNNALLLTFVINNNNNNNVIYKAQIRTGSKYSVHHVNVKQKCF